MRSQRSFSIEDILQGANPVLTIVLAAILAILGILVILYPEVLRWLVGIVLILAGVGLVTSTVTSRS
jgi:multisubunit Na+/H+ antiporter MnhC subunit